MAMIFHFSILYNCSSGFTVQNGGSMTSRWTVTQVSTLIDQQENSVTSVTGQNIIDYQELAKTKGKIHICIA